MAAGAGMKFLLWTVLLALPSVAAVAAPVPSEPVAPPPVAMVPPAPETVINRPALAPPNPWVPVEQAAPKSIRDSSIYVYSFLDFREAEFTRKVLDTLNADLEERLKGLNTSSHLLEFRKTPQGEYLSDSIGVGHSTTAVPVPAVIAGNASDEAASGAKLRLVIFPSRYDLAGAWRFYDIRWLLFVVGNKRPFLDYTYRGKHLVMWSNSENADARSKKILDALFDELKAKGLL